MHMHNVPYDCHRTDILHLFASARGFSSLLKDHFSTVTHSPPVFPYKHVLSKWILISFAQMDYT